MRYWRWLTRYPAPRRGACFTATPASNDFLKSALAAARTYLSTPPWTFCAPSSTRPVISAQTIIARVSGRRARARALEPHFWILGAAPVPIKAAPREACACRGTPPTPPAHRGPLGGVGSAKGTAMRLGPNYRQGKKATLAWLSSSPIATAAHALRFQVRWVPELAAPRAVGPSGTVLGASHRGQKSHFFGPNC